MARKYEFSNTPAWNLEQCEEVVLIDAYLEVEPFIKPTDSWRVEFENHFFTHGNGIAASFIDQINAVRRRKGLETIEIKETDISDYARAPNKQLKSETRKRVLDDLRKASTDERVRRVHRARAEMQVLPPPHYTFEQWKAKRDQIIHQNQASFMEVKRRIEAAALPPQATPKPKSLPAEKAIKMLKFATKPEVIQSIIAKLSADDALEVLPEIESNDIRDELIRHSLEHI